MPDVVSSSEMTFDQQVVLTRYGVDLGNLIDTVDGLGRDRIGFAEITLDENEDGLHRLLPRMTFYTACDPIAFVNLGELRMTCTFRS